jgi:iron complex transport system ATP-binding protein
VSLIEVQQVSFSYDRLAVLQNLSLNIETNSFWSIIGPNGSGKSTFLRLLSHGLHPQKGAILLENQPLITYSVASLARKMSLVHQELTPVFGFSVFETVLMGRHYLQKGLLFESTQDRHAVQSALEATDTLHLADRPLSHLSGGERQRVFIARALAQETPILLLDEPTSHLDLKHQVKIFDLLKQMQLRKNKTIILVSHDLNLSCQYADQMLLLAPNGHAISGTPKEIMSSGYIESVFQVKGFHGTIANETFFIPLGNLSRDQAAR